MSLHSHGSFCILCGRLSYIKPICYLHYSGCNRYQKCKARFESLFTDLASTSLFFKMLICSFIEFSSSCKSPFSKTQWVKLVFGSKIRPNPGYLSDSKTVLTTELFLAAATYAKNLYSFPLFLHKKRIKAKKTRNKKSSSMVSI